ncbi:hypothetical protein [Roseococcus pinisoli]|nr:hypothetical protein [Roseococcus pinisoli]
MPIDILFSVSDLVVVSFMTILAVAPVAVMMMDRRNRTALRAHRA